MFPSRKPLRQFANRKLATPNNALPAEAMNYLLDIWAQIRSNRRNVASLPARGITVCNDAGNLAVNIRKRCQSADVLTPVFELTTCNRRNTAVIEHECSPVQGPCEFTGLCQLSRQNTKLKSVALRCQESHFVAETLT